MDAASPFDNIWRHSKDIITFVVGMIVAPISKLKATTVGSSQNTWRAVSGESMKQCLDTYRWSFIPYLPSNAPITLVAEVLLHTGIDRCGSGLLERIDGVDSLIFVGRRHRDSIDCRMRGNSVRLLVPCQCVSSHIRIQCSCAKINFISGWQRDMI